MHNITGVVFRTQIKPKKLFIDDTVTVTKAGVTLNNRDLLAKGDELTISLASKNPTSNSTYYRKSIKYTNGTTTTYVYNTSTSSTLSTTVLVNKNSIRNCKAFAEPTIKIVLPSNVKLYYTQLKASTETNGIRTDTYETYATSKTSAGTYYIPKTAKDVYLESSKSYNDNTITISGDINKTTTVTTSSKVYLDISETTNNITITSTLKPYCAIRFDDTYLKVVSELKGEISPGTKLYEADNLTITSRGVSVSGYTFAGIRREGWGSLSETRTVSITSSSLGDYEKFTAVYSGRELLSSNKTATPDYGELGLTGNDITRKISLRILDGGSEQVSAVIISGSYGYTEYNSIGGVNATSSNKTGTTSNTMIRANVTTTLDSGYNDSSLKVSLSCSSVMLTSQWADLDFTFRYDFVYGVSWTKYNSFTLKSAKVAKEY